MRRLDRGSPALEDWTGADAALLDLLQDLRARAYAFVTPTNATLRTVRSRPEKRRARTLRDVYGWNLPFEPAVVGEALFERMQAAGVARRVEGGWVSALRVASLGGTLFLHSAFPPSAPDAVFFGPDTYRFARFLAARMPPLAEGTLVVDVGAGAGAGGVLAGSMRPQARVVLTDVNAAALRLARINAAFAGVVCETRRGEGLEPVREAVDLAIANPPFIGGRAGSVYQDGGDLHGAATSLAWAEAALARLRPGGRLLLYTGAAVVEGEDVLRPRLEALAEGAGGRLEYEEIDPDIFGSELRRAAYAGVERIAAVGAEIVKPGG